MTSILSDNNNNKDDENFLKNFLRNFYIKIIKTKDFNNFEKIFSEWINHHLKIHDKNPKKILELMKNHEMSEFWFISFIGFFYQLGIGCNINKDKALKLYLSCINVNEIEKDSLNENFDKLHSPNAILAPGSRTNQRDWRH